MEFKGYYSRVNAMEQPCVVYRKQLQTKHVYKTREQRLEELVECLDRLLVCYRLGSRPSELLLDKIKKLRKDCAK